MLSCMDDKDLIDRLRLIRDGATLVQNVDDILNVLSQTDRMETPPPEPY